MPSLEKCCGKCRTPFQICGLKRQCKCHRDDRSDAQIQLDRFTALLAAAAEMDESEVW